MQPRKHESTNKNIWVFSCLRGCVCLFLVSFVVAPQATQQPTSRGGAIRGRVELGYVAQTGERPGVSALGAPRDRDAPDRRKSVVYLESAPRAAFDQIEPARAAMDQRNETFVPH